MHNGMRLKESWMRKGAAITKSGMPGKIINFHTSIVGPDNQTYVHSMVVRLKGAPAAYPFNPNDIDPVQRQRRETA